MVIIVANTSEEIEQAFEWLNQNGNADAIVKADEIKKQKKSEYDKQRYQERKNSIVKNVESEEEKEKKEKESTKEKEIKEKEEIIYISPDTKKVTKKPYGSGANVMLTEEQYWKLCDKFGVIDANNKIEKASMYFASKGKAKEYKDHYMTILNWDRMDRERKMNGRKSWTEIADQLSQEMDDLPQL